jgi:hypothetical protein
MPLAALVVVLAILAAGCESQGREMTVLNQTSKTIQINYRHQVWIGTDTVDKEDAVKDAGPGQRVILFLHRAEPGCLHGTLRAVQDGRTIAALSQPCEGTEWVIPAAPGSPASP